MRFCNCNVLAAGLKFSIERRVTIDAVGAEELNGMEGSYQNRGKGCSSAMWKSLMHKIVGFYE